MKDRAVIALLVLIVFFSCLPLFKNIHNINLDFDWLQMASYYRADRQAVLEFRQFPFRTHYFGGGYPLLANPQDGALSPFFLAPLLFGEVVGVKVNVFLAHLVGLLGMYYLARFVLKFSIAGASFSAVVFCLGGHMHRLLVRGQDYIPSFYFFFVPLLVALFLKSRHDKRFLLATALALAVVAAQAGLYFVPIVFFIFLFACLKAVGLEKKKAVFDFVYLRDFFFILGLALLLAAVKVLPMLELLIQNPRSMDSYNPFWPPLFPNIFKAFFVHILDFPSPGQHWNYFYLGYIPVLSALFSFAAYRRQAWREFVLLVVFSLLAFGAHTRLDLFGLLRRLPFFGSIEAPTRYFVPLVLFLIALNAGRAFGAFEKRKNRFWTFLSAGLVLFVAGDLLWTHTPASASFPVVAPSTAAQALFFPVKNAFPGEKASPQIPSKMFETRSWEWTRPTQYELMLRNIGKINWYGNIHLAEQAFPRFFIFWNGADSLAPQNFFWFPNPRYRGEVYFLDYPKNQARFLRLSPNEIVAEVMVHAPDTLVINQNFDKSWRCDAARPVATDGLLSVPLDRAGLYRVRFVYGSAAFSAGLLVSLAALLFTFYFFKKWTSA